jgi:hypothetical protein
MVFFAVLFDDFGCRIIGAIRSQRQATRLPAVRSKASR